MIPSTVLIELAISFGIIMAGVFLSSGKLSKVVMTSAEGSKAFLDSVVASSESDFRHFNTRAKVLANLKTVSAK